MLVALIRSIGPVPWGEASIIAGVASAAWLAAGWLFIWRHACRATKPALKARIGLWWLGGMAALFAAMSRIDSQPWVTAWPADLLATVSWGLALPLALGLAFGLCGWRFVASLLTGLHDNLWGICSGLSTQGDTPVAGLTVWLTRYFNEVAGLDTAARPLTLGDLWSGDRVLGDDPSEAEDTPLSERKINLEVMTTAVTRQMPYALPLRPGAGAYFFDPEEWKRLFPPSVMNWLLEASPPIPANGGARTRDGRPLRRLPCNRHLPVVLLVRMSLSFPVLLSAVPMYAFDYSGKAESAFPKKVWFSDGGIASNMPLHFFDAPLPGHPTFAVNLKDEHPDHPIRADVDACALDNGRVYLPDNNAAGLQQYWKEIDESSSLGLFNLLWRMVETMRTWHDEIQLPMPGYRDRVVQIAHKPREGGLNLDMPSGHIEALSAAGACAAKRLIERFSFAAGQPLSEGWKNHRQIRMRMFIALSEMLGRHPSVHDPAWRELLATGDVPYDAVQRQMAVHTFDALGTIGPAVDRESQLALLEKAPRPRPVWRIVPRI
ncbi:patatin-like phospholipase family protein [Variovorax sp. PBL-H6]|uniref:patatin-like phospholipase family protein n=1 Tax=Variovorax sp. PBL-H6 TaxID=434009 RepID=UPI001E5D7772|nr:patatin-like phospholipase family protein [Variovorax sp. PBL-H6]